MPQNDPGDCVDVSPVSEFDLEIGLLLLIEVVFLLILAVRIIAFGLRLRVLIQRKMLGDVKLFMHEYWDWRNARNNFLGISLGLSAVAAAGAIVAIQVHFEDIPLLRAASEHPLSLTVICLSLAALCVYSGYRIVEQKKTMEELCKGLDRLRLFRMYKGTIGLAQALPFMESTAGKFASFGLEALKQISDSVVHGAIKKGMRTEMAEFALITAVEYGARITILLLAVYTTR